MNKPLILAYYLPQFHPFKENDEWWGKGFTEWTNVGKAKPLFKGHYQPKVPGELGYYDLRLPEIAEEQARLATEAGVHGFCYWHYWFGEGRELMEMPFYRMLNTGKPDFPFCLGWANESWMAKFWDKDAKGLKGKLLIEQRYSKEDHIAHFEQLLPAFTDARYVKVDGRPFFLVYRPLEFPGMSDFLTLWNDLLRQKTGYSFYFVAHARNESEVKLIMKMGFDAVNIFPLSRAPQTSRSYIIDQYEKIRKRVTGIPRLVNYSHVIEDTWVDGIETDEHVIPTLIPNWDHSPRSGINALILDGSTPENWRRHVKRILDGVSHKSNKLIMLKSWNEWGEGNYLEPDLRYGKQFIEVLGQEISKYH